MPRTVIVAVVVLATAEIVVCRLPSSRSSVRPMGAEPGPQLVALGAHVAAPAHHEPRAAALDGEERLGGPDPGRRDVGRAPGQVHPRDPVLRHGRDDPARPALAGRRGERQRPLGGARRLADLRGRAPADLGERDLLTGLGRDLAAGQDPAGALPRRTRAETRGFGRPSAWRRLTIGVESASGTTFHTPGLGRLTANHVRRWATAWNAEELARSLTGAPGCGSTRVPSGPTSATCGGPSCPMTPTTPAGSPARNVTARWPPAWAAAAVAR